MPKFTTKIKLKTDKKILMGWLNVNPVVTANHMLAMLLNKAQIIEQVFHLLI